MQNKQFDAICVRPSFHFLSLSQLSLYFFSRALEGLIAGYSDVHVAVTLMSLSVVTAVTLVCTVMLQRCHSHRCCTVVSLHRWHTNVAAIPVAVLSRSLLSQLKIPLSQHCHYHRCHTSGKCHRCDIGVDSSVTVV